MTKRLSENPDTDDSKRQVTKAALSDSDESLTPAQYREMFFSGEQVDDVYVICKNWSGGRSYLELYFVTLDMAQQFLKRVQENDRVEPDAYQIVMLRRGDGSDQLLCDSLVLKRPMAPKKD